MTCGFSPVEVVIQVGTVTEGFIVGAPATAEGTGLLYRVPFSLLPFDRITAEIADEGLPG